MMCNAQHIIRKTQGIPEGKWVCVQDPLSTMVVKKNLVLEYYNHKLISSTKYLITKQSCDITHKNLAKNPYFLIWHEGLCYEVEGITEKYIELIYTSTGATLTYSRRK